MIFSSAFVGSDTPAFGCGIAAALLSLAGVSLVTAASGCFGRFGAAAAVAPARGTVRKVCAALAWLLVVAAAVMFLCGASRNVGGTGGFTAVERRPGSSSDGRAFDFVCTELRDGVFESASLAAAAGIACAIAAYVDALRQRDQTATLGVAMGQPQWSSQPPYPAPVAYPPYCGYGAKQPAGAA
ncbi:uncharacterized protein C2845_PM12G19910 [Panicum miliaceum]|uniref:Uncharacterized protein n=1 Tax=Panicum miliaceum TaxID=4540 RepID=A0A3L6QDZ0_PANMI|nr:uncharacterized protein C2845_PM12G19910 [Panicum miliaceum]